MGHLPNAVIHHKRSEMFAKSCCPGLLRRFMLHACTFPQLDCLGCCDSLYQVIWTRVFYMRVGVVWWASGWWKLPRSGCSPTVKLQSSFDPDCWLTDIHTTVSPNNSKCCGHGKSPEIPGGAPSLDVVWIPKRLGLLQINQKRCKTGRF